MKSQTFGVEIEMNNITRDAAAKLAAEFFGTNNYRHIGGGYDTWEAIDANGQPWKFMNDASIAGPAYQHCEMVTPILVYSDIERLQDLVRKLRSAGAKSCPNQGCGVHIHVGAQGQTPESIRNLVNIMASHETLLINALKLDRGRLGSYCKPVDPRFLKAINDKKPKTMGDLADVWYQSQGEDFCRTAHYNQSRYHMLNLHATFTKGTIEFRLFQFNNPGRNFKGGLHAGMLKSYIQLCLALCARAKAVKFASNKPMQMANQKFAMRTWLVQKLGFVGDEFKTARDILTRNLVGHSALRYGVNGEYRAA